MPVGFEPAGPVPVEGSVPSGPGMTAVSNKPAEPAAVQYDSDGKPIAPPGPKRSMPMDVLLN